MLVVLVASLLRDAKDDTRFARLVPRGRNKKLAVTYPHWEYGATKILA